MMLPFLSITGISIFIILIYFNIRKFPSSLYLGLYFLLVSFYCFRTFITLYSKSVFLISITFVHLGFLSFITGPLLYWYVRSVLTDDHHFKKTDFLHFLPMVVFLVGTIPYYFMPFEDKVRIAGNIVRDASYLGIFDDVTLFQLLSPSVIYMSRPIIILGYTIWSAILLVTTLVKNKPSPVITRQYFIKGWLFILLSFTFLFNMAHFLSLYRTYIFHNVAYLYSLNLFQILSATGLTGLIIFPFFFPRILYGMPRLPDQFNSMEANTVPGKQVKEEIKKPALHLENEYLLSIKQKVDSCMKTMKPYVKPDFNLPQLSVLIEIPVHHLAYFFREITHKSFNDYRNEWRVKHAKELIKDGKACDMTLEAIGFLSGFSNRNSFRLIFQKLEGVSPSVFAANEQKSNSLH